jgi:hypothetical protein
MNYHHYISFRPEIKAEILAMGVIIQQEAKKVRAAAAAFGRRVGWRFKGIGMAHVNPGFKIGIWRGDLHRRRAAGPRVYNFENG